jgi:hypothetical protein
MKKVCRLFPSHIKEVPVSVALTIILTVSSLIHLTHKDKFQLDCNNFLSLLSANFIQADINQLTVNIFSIYTLSNIELTLGSKKYLSLFVSALLIYTTLLYEFHKIIPTLDCPLGFSSLIFSILVWNFLLTKMLNPSIVILLVITFIYLSLHYSQILLLNFGIAALTGLILSKIPLFSVKSISTLI